MEAGDSGRVRDSYSESAENGVDESVAVAAEEENTEEPPQNVAAVVEEKEQQKNGEDAALEWSGFSKYNEEGM